MQRRHEIYSSAYAAATLKLLDYSPHAPNMPHFDSEGQSRPKKPTCTRCYGSGCPDTLEKVIFRLPPSEYNVEQHFVAHKTIVEKRTTLLKYPRPQSRYAVKNGTVEVPTPYGDVESSLVFLEFCYTGRSRLMLRRSRHHKSKMRQRRLMRSKRPRRRMSTGRTTRSPSGTVVRRQLKMRQRPNTLSSRISLPTRSPPRTKIRKKRRRQTPRPQRNTKQNKRSTPTRPTQSASKPTAWRRSSAVATSANSAST